MLGPQSKSQEAARGKTKAKTRYLKRKKERRKHRAHGQPDAKPKAPSDGEALSDVDDDDVSVSTSAPVAKATEPPRKRRKVDTDDEDPLTSERDEVDEEAASAPAPRSPTPPAALPSFPLPVAPDAPSKATLALQGLDKALLSADIIDPAHTRPIDTLAVPDSSADLPILSEKMLKRLKELGISEFFAVQTALLPFLLPPQRRKRALYCPYDPPRDVCASAPTGSGKTLAYVVPIVEILSVRIATRLRALVVLPTRDLVLQVQETFGAVSKGRGLKIGVATGQHSFAHEQAQLVGDQSRLLHGGASKVDILICTPGRLIDHLAGTRNFTLQHLRFLVVDEADRLLAQSFQDWLARVLAALRSPPPSTDVSSSLSSDVSPPPSDTREVPYHDALAPSFLASAAFPSLSCVRTDFDDPTHSSCQKLLFSATLTRDPARIAALGLRDAKYFVVQGKDSIPDETVEDGEEAMPLLGTEGFAMPSGLKEHFLTSSPARKPLILFHLLHTRGVSNALVFTKSAESTARLVRLLEFFEEAYVTAPPPVVPSTGADNEVEAEVGGREQPRKRIVARAYSSDLPAGERKMILEQFKNQSIDLLVCSDLVARGIDIPHVAHVVSYDVPVDMRKYVHRVGRTARAGRGGDAWTLVEDQEARFFKGMLREAARLGHVRKIRVAEKEVAGLVGCYETALDKLREAYSRST